MDNNLKNFYKRITGHGSLILSEQAKARIKGKAILQIKRIGQQTEASFMLRLASLIPIMVPVVVVLLIIVGVGAGSAKALPGDFLYPVKLRVESAQVFLAPTPLAKLNLQVNFAEKRLVELEQVKNSAPRVPEPPKNNVPANNTPPINSTGNSNANINANGDKNKHDNSVSNLPSEKEIQAKQQADQALNSLVKVKDTFHEKGDNKQAEDLTRTINDLKDKLKKIDSGDKGGRDSSGH